MKKLLLIITLFVSANSLFAQNRFFTKTGKITFDATSPSSPDKIYASNEKATSVIDASNGAMEFALLMKAFSFEKALMQEHFNENYVESDKYPKAVFKGSVTNIKDVNLQKDGSYPVKIKGNMTMHGVTKEVTADGKLVVKAGNIVSGVSNFSILLSDFNVGIPSLVKDKVSPEAKITVDISYDPLKAS
ncbi:MAG TPA: YceI family protein [Bacteroidia bacterium]|nr:YceI family protein [Bacteroidia bacterium]